MYFGGLVMLTIDIQIRVNWGNRRHSDKTERGQVKKGKKRESRLFFALMERERERLLRLGRYNTAANYRTALNSFRQFRQGKDLTIGEITPDLMVAYEGWLRDRGIAHNTSSCYMRALRAVYNRMVERGLTKQRAPFRKIYTGIEKTVRLKFGKEVIRRLESLSLPFSSLLCFARDLFVFSLLACGMPFVDLAFLRKEQIRDGYLVYHRHKTGKRIRLRLNKRMLEIIHDHSVPEGTYLFPILDYPADSRQAHTQYRQGLNRYNRLLRVLAVKAGIKEPLSSYTSRYTWANCAYQENVGLAVISKGLGHSQPRTTQVYIQDIDDTSLDQANIRIVNKLFKEDNSKRKRKKNSAQEFLSPY